MERFCYIILGFIGGLIYYHIIEKDIPRDVNCSFVANIWTDLLAFVYGAIIIYYGFIHKNNVLIILGTSIITEHRLQFFYHKI